MKTHKHLTVNICASSTAYSCCDTGTSSLKTTALTLPLIIKNTFKRTLHLNNLQKIVLNFLHNFFNKLVVNMDKLSTMSC